MSPRIRQFLKYLFPQNTTQVLQLKQMLRSESEVHLFQKHKKSQCPQIKRAIYATLRERGYSRQEIQLMLN